MKTIIPKLLVVFSIILLSVQLNAQTKINKLEIEGDALEVVTSKSMTADVSGTLSSGEDPKECAKRELAEETGYRVGCLEKIGEIAPVPDFSDDIIHIFLGTDLKPGPQALQEDESLRVKELSITNAIDMIMIGKIIDAKTIIGILLTNPMMYDRNSEVMSVKKRK